MEAKGIDRVVVVVACLLMVLIVTTGCSKADKPSVSRGNPRFGPPTNARAQRAGGVVGFRISMPSYGPPAFSGTTAILPVVDRPGIGAERSTQVAAYDVRNGKLLWHRVVGCDVGATPVGGGVADGVAIFRCTDGDGPVRGIDLKTGAERWRSTLDAAWYDQEVTVSGGRALLQAGSHVQVVTVATGAIVLRETLATRGSAALLGDLLVVGGTHTTTAIDMAGHTRWRVATGSVGLWLDGRSLVGLSVTGQAHRLTRTGASTDLGWRLPRAEYGRGVAEGHLLTGSGDGKVRSRLIDSGRIAWTVAASDEGLPTLQGGQALVSGVGSSDWQLRDIRTGAVRATGGPRTLGVADGDHHYLLVASAPDSTVFTVRPFS